MAIKIKFIGDVSSLEKASNRATKVLGDVAKVAGGFVLAKGLLQAPAALSNIANAAKNLQLQQQKSDIVFGESIGVIQKWAAANANAMGLTRAEAVNLAAGLADLLIPMGFTREEAAKMSAKTLELAGALAQWSGGQKTAAEVSEILQAAYLGETDGLKALGIAISAADVTAQLAAKGQDKLTGAALKQAQAIAIQELIFAKSTDAQTAWAKSVAAGGDAATIQSAKVKELKEQFQRGLGPVIQNLQAALLPLLVVALTKIGQVFEANQPRIAAFANELKNRTPGAVAVVMQYLAAFLSMVSTVISGVITGFGAMASAIGQTMSAIATVVSTVGRAIYTAMQWLNPFARHSPPLVDQVRDGVALIKREFASLIDVNGKLTAVSAGVRAFEQAMAGTAATIASSDLAGKLDNIRRTGGPEAVAAYNSATAAIADMRAEYSRLGTELAKTKANLQDQKGVLDALKFSLEAEAKALDKAKAKVAELGEQVDDARRRFDDFRRTPLLEDKQFNDALKLLDTAMTEIELKIVKLKQKGPLEFVDADGKTQLTATGKAVADLEAQLDKLRLQADQTELEQKLAIGPLEDALNDLDATAAEPFDTIYEGAKDAKGELDDLTAAQKAQQDAVDKAQASYDENAASVAKAQQEYDDNTAALEDQEKAYQDLATAIDEQAAVLDKYADIAATAVQREEARAQAAEAAAKASDAAAAATGGAADALGDLAAAPPVGDLITPEAQTALKELGEAPAKFKASWEEAKASFEEVKTNLREIKDQLAPIGSFFKEWENVKAVIQGLALGLGIYAGVVATLNAALVITKTATWAVETAQKAWNLASAASPWGALALVLTAVLIPAIILLITHWDEITEKFPILGEATDAIKEKWEQFTKWIEDTFVPAVKSVAETITGAVQAAVKFVQDNWDKIRDKIEPALTLLVAWIATQWEAIQIGIETVLGVIKGIVDVFMGVFTGDWQRAWDGVKAIVDSLWTGIKETFNLGLKFLTEDLLPLIGEAGSKIGGALKDGFVAGIKGLVGLGNSVGNAVLDLLETALNKMVSMANAALPNHVGISVAGKDLGFDIPQFPNFSIPRLAAGTSFADGGLTLVGEEGPELVNMERGAQVYPADKTAEMLGGGGSPVSMTVNIYLPPGDDRAHVKRIIGLIDDELTKLTGRKWSPA